MKALAVFLFDYSGAMARPWADAGYDCLIVDIQHRGFRVLEQPAGTIYAHEADLTQPYQLPDALADRQVIFVAAFPPCDHLAVSGARWFKGKGLKALAWSIQCFAVAVEFAESQDCPYCLENPVSTISTYWRKPDHIFHPHHYAGLEPDDHYTKTTCLWTGGGFVMPEPVPLETDRQPDNRIHRCAPGPERKNIRSRTPSGFARAVFIVNAPAWGMTA